MIKRKVFTKY